MIRLIIFDYDGVIVDSFVNVYKVYKIICKKLDKKFPANIDEFKKIYGNSSTECYSNLSFSEEEKLKGNLIFKEEILKKEGDLFSGIKEVLEKLHRNYKLVLISSSYKVEVIQKLERFGIYDFFDYVVGKERDSGRLEKTDTIKEVVKKFKVKEEEVLSIGDRNVDFIEGSTAGLKNILLVDYGWGYDLNEIPEYKQRVVIKKPKDILKAIEEM